MACDESMCVKKCIFSSFLQCDRATYASPGAIIGESSHTIHSFSVCPCAFGIVGAYAGINGKAVFREPSSFGNVSGYTWTTLLLASFKKTVLPSICSTWAMRPLTMDSCLFLFCVIITLMPL